MSWPLLILTAEQCDALRAQFPRAFGLRGFPGDTFRVSTTFSFIGDDGSVVVYTERWNAKSQLWQAFSKGSAAEVRREMVSL